MMKCERYSDVWSSGKQNAAFGGSNSNKHNELAETDTDLPTFGGDDRDDTFDDSRDTGP